MMQKNTLVTRKKYNNDIIFRIKSIEGNIVYLEGVNERLCADCNIDDLIEYSEDLPIENDADILDRLELNLDRDNYFYIPGKILHIDADKNYLNRCLKFYKNVNINAYGVLDTEENIPNNIEKYLKDINPDIVVITGHDSFNKFGTKDDIMSYKNSKYFERAIKIARDYEKSYDKLKILAGACQSDYEDLIKAGANFASSPKRINIHALDLSIVATSIALTDNTKSINIIDILNKTKCKIDGIGGIKTHGSMLIGCPR